MRVPGPPFVRVPVPKTPPFSVSLLLLSTLTALLLANAMGPETEHPVKQPDARNAPAPLPVPFSETASGTLFTLLPRLRVAPFATTVLLPGPVAPRLLVLNTITVPALI